MDLIPTFVNRKHGREPVEYPHPLVEPVLAETYGIMVYQEQVMQTARCWAATAWRRRHAAPCHGQEKGRRNGRAPGIFRKELLKRHRQGKADEVFDLMEKFAGYGFNKSHAAAYSLLAYHTGWLKVHYTAEFSAPT